jgi:hypothetical protein
MGFEIRPYAAADADDLVALSLQAWEPVFDALRSALGLVRAVRVAVRRGLAQGTGCRRS